MTRSSFETGLSHLVWDHIWIILYTILKTKFENFELKKLIYRNFKQYYSDQFKLSIFNIMSAMRTNAAFGNNFVSILDKQAPKKMKSSTRESKLPF